MCSRTRDGTAVEACDDTIGFVLGSSRKAVRWKCSDGLHLLDSSEFTGANTGVHVIAKISNGRSFLSFTIRAAHLPREPTTSPLLFYLTTDLKHNNNKSQERAVRKFHLRCAACTDPAAS